MQRCSFLTLIAFCLFGGGFSYAHQLSAKCIQAALDFENRFDHDQEVRGMSGHNRIENKAFDRIVKRLRLNKDQARTLHDLISGQELSEEEIVDLAQEIFRER